MTSLIFEFKDETITTVPITILETDLQEGIFGTWVIEALTFRDSMNQNTIKSPHLIVSLDIPDLKNATIDEVRHALRGYQQLFEYRRFTPSGLSRSYPSNITATADGVLRNLTETERVVLLTMIHYLGNDTLLGVLARSYSELLVGLSVEELRNVLGYARHDYPTSAQTKELHTYYQL